MVEIFARAWPNGDVVTDNPRWHEALMKLTSDEIKQGEKVIYELAEDFPPNLMQFVKYAKHGMPRDKVNDVVRPNFNQGQLPPNYEAPALPNPDGLNMTQRAGKARRELQDFYKSKDKVSHETKEREPVSTEGTNPDPFREHQVKYAERQE